MGNANGQEDSPTSSKKPNANETKNVFELLGCILELENPLLDLDQDTLIAVHKELQKLSSEERQQLLQIYCGIAGYKKGISGIILCQCSFERFPPARLGEPSFLKKTSKQKPTHPIQIINGKPTITVNDHRVSGFAEHPSFYLKRCIENRDSKSKVPTNGKGQNVK